MTREKNKNFIQRLLYLYQLNILNQKNPFILEFTRERGRNNIKNNVKITKNLQK